MTCLVKVVAAAREMVAGCIMNGRTKGDFGECQGGEEVVACAFIIWGMKGNFDECEMAMRMLVGTGTDINGGLEGDFDVKFYD